MPAASIQEITAATAGQTAPGRFLDLVAEHPDAPALRSRTADGSWRTWTYGEYADLVARAAAGLDATGLQPGERLGLLMRNRPDFHWFDAAAQFLRVTPVSIYQTSSADEIRYLLDHAEIRVMIVEDEAFLSRVLSVAAELPRLERIYVVDPPAGAQPAGVAPAADLLDNDGLDLDELADAVDPTDIATLIYTSGTTGPPKGVMISQANVVYTVEQLRRCLPLESLLGRRVVSYLPMAHIAERMTSHYQAMVGGFDVYCCPAPDELATFLREVRPEVVFGVPRVWEKLRSGVLAALAGAPERLTMFEQAVAQAVVVKAAERAGTVTPQQQAMWQQFDQLAFRNVRTLLGLDATVVAISGAAPIPVPVLEWFGAIGVPLSEIYGLSETSGPMTWSPERNKPGYVGRPIPGCEVRVADDGEVCCRGGNVFQGYFKRPDATAEVLRDGWFHTGDIGEFDDEGYLRIIDRKKELIITSGGKNISPANLEAALKTIPLVGQAAAIGDNRKFVSALLALDPDAARAWAARHGRPTTTSLAELARDPELVREVAMGVARVNRQFAQVERIKRFTLVGEEWLPGSDLLTPTSKLKRRGIQARYAADIEAMYAGADEVAATPPPAAPTAPAAPARRPEPSPPPGRAGDDDTGGDHEPWDAYGNGFGDTWVRRWWWVIALGVVGVAALAYALLLRSDTNSSTPATTPALEETTLPTVAPTAAPTAAPPTAGTTAAPTTTTGPSTLLATLERLDNTSVFVRAVRAAGLEAELEAAGPTTLFVPTDEAFAKLSADQLNALLADRQALTQLLRHHMVDGLVAVEDLVDGPLEARDGTFIEVTAVDDLLLDERARLVLVNRAATNGILHTVDTVLVPPGMDLSTLGGSTTTTSPSTTAAPTTTRVTTGPGMDVTVPFDPGSGVLNREGRTLVRQAAESIKALPRGSEVIVTGVTDDLGDDATNEYLARLRARSVIDELKARGATNVTYVVKTLQEPYDKNDPERSRRVDIDLP